MGLGLTQQDYEQMTNDFYYANSPYRKYGQWKTNDSATNSLQSSNTDNTSVFSSQSTHGNKCTDGEDDGKIGFFSAAGNIIEGVGKGLVNSVKGMFTNKEGKFSLWQTVKTVAIGAACFIPVVGPVIGTSLAAYGLYNGSKTIITAAIKADQATTDAEAKAAFEEIGSGALTTAVSAVGLKASAGALRGQLAANTTSATVQAIRSKASLGSIAKTAISETGANMYGTAASLAKGVKNKISKVSQFADDVKTNGFRNTVKTRASNTFNNVKTKISNMADDLAQKQEKLNNKATEQAKTAKEKAATTKANTEKNIEAAKKLAQDKKIPAKDCYKNGVPKEVTTKQNGTTTTVKYDMNGNITSKVEVGKVNGKTTTTTTQYKNGEISSKVTETANRTGTKTSKTIENYKDGNVYETKVTDSKTTTRNGKQNTKTSEKTTYDIHEDGYTKTGSQTKVDGKVTQSDVNTTKTSKNGNKTTTSDIIDESNIRTKSSQTVDANGNNIKSKSTSVDADGKTIASSESRTGKSGSSYESNSKYNPETKKMDTTTTVDIGGQGAIENATWIDKAFAKLDSGKFGNFTTSTKLTPEFVFEHPELVSELLTILQDEETLQTLE